MIVDLAVQVEEEQEGEELVVVGVIREAEPVPKKEKLTKLVVEVGGGVQLPIVTNAKHCEVRCSVLRCGVQEQHC